MNKKFVTMDGNEAAAHMAYPFTEIAAIGRLRWRKRAVTMKGRKHFAKRAFLTVLASFPVACA